jgi:hypothetical protein
LGLPVHYEQLVHLSEAELASHDIAAVNLACAAGLNGAEGLDVARCIAVVDAWADHVGREAARCAGQFERDPAAFENSWAYFRILVLATVLQQDCGVRYDPTLVHRDDFFANAENLFIHGILQGKGGTCSSLPPVYVAVGRRLGYPLRLVQTHSHLFARWDEGGSGERFNIECTSQGLNCHTDDYYRGWPVPTQPQEERHYGWLLSQTPREDLGTFLTFRGHCCLDNDQYREAVEAYAWACSLSCRHQGYEGCLVAALNRWQARLEPLAPPDSLRPTVPLPRRRLPGLALDLERAIIRLEEQENLFAAH